MQARFISRECRLLPALEAVALYGTDQWQRSSRVREAGGVGCGGGKFVDGFGSDGADASEARTIASQPLIIFFPFFGGGGGGVSQLQQSDCIHFTEQICSQTPHVCGTLLRNSQRTSQRPLTTLTELPDQDFEEAKGNRHASLSIYLSCVHVPDRRANHWFALR